MRTGLPFHVDGPFFVERKGRKAFLVDNGDGNGDISNIMIKNSVQSSDEIASCLSAIDGYS